MNWELQKSVFARLDGSTAIKAVVKGIYDHVPQPVDSGDDTQFPYITIGADTVREFDTDDVLGFDARVEIHVWSRQRGRKQTKELQDLIYDRMHRATLTIAGYHFISCDHEFSDSFVDPDGLTRHGVQQFRVLADKLPPPPPPP
jgi:hypothetical protein